MKKVAISACLMGCQCRYDATDNLNPLLLEQLTDYELVPFCPEDHAFGSPRPTMDLVDNKVSIEAVSNETGRVLSSNILAYAHQFFDTYANVDLFIGKDRSPSCGVQTAKIYDEDQQLITTKGIGLMAKVAKQRGIPSFDAEVYGISFDEKQLRN